MSWGTYYKHEGYLSRIAKRDIEDEIKKAEDLNNLLWSKILVLAAFHAGSEPNKEEFSPDRLIGEVNEIREEIEWNSSMLTRLYDAKSAQEENPLNVHDDSDDWNEEENDWADVVEAKKAQSKIE